MSLRRSFLLLCTATACFCSPYARCHHAYRSTTRGMGYALAASALAGAAAAAADSACAGAAVVRWLVPAPAFLVRITRTPCLPSRLYAATYEKIVHPRGCILKSLLLRLVSWSSSRRSRSPSSRRSTCARSGQRVLLPARPILGCPIARGVDLPAYYAAPRYFRLRGRGVSFV